MAFILLTSLSGNKQSGLPKPGCYV